MIQNVIRRTFCKDVFGQQSINLLPNASVSMSYATSDGSLRHQSCDLFTSQICNSAPSFTAGVSCSPWLAWLPLCIFQACRNLERMSFHHYNQTTKVMKSFCLGLIMFKLVSCEDNNSFMGVYVRSSYL